VGFAGQALRSLVAVDGGRGAARSWFRVVREIFQGGFEGNSSGRFLEVAVYDVGGRRGMVVFPEGRDGRGWGRVSGELSKVLVFLGSKMVSSSSSGAPAGKILGKVAGVLSFAEVVRSPAPVVVDGPQVQSVPVVWCEMEAYSDGSGAGDDSVGRGLLRNGVFFF